MAFYPIDFILIRVEILKTFLVFEINFEILKCIRFILGKVNFICFVRESFINLELLYIQIMEKIRVLLIKIENLEISPF